MEKLKQKLKSVVKDEIAAFIILGVIIIVFAIIIGVKEYNKYTKIAEANSNLDIQETQEKENIQNNFETLNNVTSQDDLKKLEEEKSKEEKENEKEKKTRSSHKYYIKVNYGAQVVNIYTKDSKGNYTVPVKAMVCSTGTHTPTSGVYTIGYRWEWLEMIGSVYGHYVTQINGDILFHSVPYLEKGNHSSLEWWAYDQLGTKASLGCVRLTTKDALWIFNNVSSGTKVEFYSSSNPGPLGKPSAMKISNAPSNIKGWDPTDPDSRNPWPDYLEGLEENNNKPNKPDSEDEDKNEGNKNEEKNNTVNDIKNDIENDVQNDIKNDIKNDIENDIENEITNNIENEVENNINNNVIDTNLIENSRIGNN